MKKLAAVFLFLFGAAFAQAKQPVQSEPASCALEEVASLDMTFLPDGRISVPVKIDGHDGSMMLDIAGHYSAITYSAANTLGLKIYDLAPKIISFAGKIVSNGATANQITLGAVPVANVSFLVIPNGKTNANNAAVPLSDDLYRGAGTAIDSLTGILATDLLEKFDIELDFHGRKLNLFSQNHCNGHAVYWADSAAIIPFTETVRGGIQIPMVLDGKPINAGLGTMGMHNIMLLNRAQDIFDIDPSAMAPVAWHDADISAYQYIFNSLSGGGIAMSKPKIVLLAPIQRHDDDPKITGRVGNFVYLDDELQDRGYSSKKYNDLELGLNQLESLRIFISYSESVIYITAADAHK